jgi:hypothetical protein
MGLFKSIKKAFKKITGAVKKVVKGVAKGVKKVVKGVGKVIKKVGKGVKKLAKNKIVRAALMITAAVMLPGAIALMAPSTLAVGTLANAAVTGAIMGGGGALLAGGDLKDVLKGAALGSATGAAFRGIANKVNQLGAQPAVDAGTTTVETATGDLVAGASDDIVLGASEDIVSSQVASPLDVSADISSTVADTAASSQGLIEEMVVYGQPTPAPSVADYATPITVASTDLLKIDPQPAPIVTEPEQSSYLARTGEAIKESLSPENLVSAGGNFLLGAAETAIAQRMQGDPENIGAYGARPETIGASLLEQFQVAYQEAGININDAYKNMTYGSGDINAIQNELFRQETLRIA